jgi:hypothetical protein
VTGVLGMTLNCVQEMRGVAPLACRAQACPEAADDIAASGKKPRHAAPSRPRVLAGPRQTKYLFFLEYPLQGRTLIDLEDDNTPLIYRFGVW